MAGAAAALVVAIAHKPHQSPPPQVRWSVLSSWHELRLTSLALVGLPVTAADAPALAEMLGAGCGQGLTRLVLVSVCCVLAGGGRCPWRLAAATAVAALLI